MCLRAACRYNVEDQTLTLQNGLVLSKPQLAQGGLGLLVEPIFEFAMGLAKLQLDQTEIALLAAVLLMQSGMVAQATCHSFYYCLLPLLLLPLGLLFSSFTPSPSRPPLLLHICLLVLLLVLFFFTVFLSFPLLLILLTLSLIILLYNIM